MENNKTPIKFYTVEELVELLHVNKDTIYRYINHGTTAKGDLKLKTTKLGRRQLISEQDLQEFLNAQSK